MLKKHDHPSTAQLIIVIRYEIQVQEASYNTDNFSMCRCVHFQSYERAPKTRMFQPAYWSHYWLLTAPAWKQQYWLTWRRRCCSIYRSNRRDPGLYRDAEWFPACVLHFVPYGKEAHSSNRLWNMRCAILWDKDFCTNSRHGRCMCTTCQLLQAFFCPCFSENDTCLEPRNNVPKDVPAEGEGVGQGWIAAVVSVPLL